MARLFCMMASAWSKIEAIFCWVASAGNGISIFSSDFNAVELCFDKYLFVKNNQVNFNIQTSLNIDELKNVDKYVVKDRFGSGSKSIGINLDYEEAKAFGKNIENPIFQEYIDGEEYSIDSYVTKTNSFIGMKQFNKNKPSILSNDELTKICEYK